MPKDVICTSLRITAYRQRGRETEGQNCGSCSIADDISRAIFLTKGTDYVSLLRNATESKGEIW